MDELIKNARKPEGELGQQMIERMNKGHVELASWAMKFIDVQPEHIVLDLGCGGGVNVETFTTKCTDGHVTGLDYSPLCVKNAIERNKKAIDANKCSIIEGDVMDLPFEDDTFDIVTAFETIYFWPDLATSFKEVKRVLKPGGMFVICNETNKDTETQKIWKERVGDIKFYTAEELAEILTNAGFADAMMVTKDKPYDWICIFAI